MIKRITVKSSTGNQTVEVGQVEPNVAERLIVNESGNFEILSSGTNVKGDPQKVNVNSAGDIQIKTGSGSVLQLDSENEKVTADKADYSIKVCNGAFGKANRVIRAKVNVAELILDTQNAHDTAVGDEDTFDKEEMQIKFRYDKANHPIYAKMKARAFDFRCLDHGGIALQIAGQDSDSHENKIKFESDRASAINETALYTGEGGKGVEFGTFNNLHTSLYTGDYRFKGDAKVYGATRGEITMYDGDGNVTEVAVEAKKYDYPTQADDFKDIVSEGNQATWNEIIKVARDYADGTLVGGSGVEDEEGNRVDMSLYATKAFAETIETTANEALTKANLVAPAAGVMSKTGSNNLKISSAAYDIAEVHHTDEEGNTVIDTPAYKAALNLESNGNIKIEPKANLDVKSPMFNVNSSKNEISMSAAKMTLSNGTAVVPVEAENGISLGITSRIISVGTKVSTKGKLEKADATLELAYLNNNPNTAYVIGGKVHIPYDLKDFYVKDASAENGYYVYDPVPGDDGRAKVAAFVDTECTIPIEKSSVYYVKGSDNNVWLVETNSDGQFKKYDSKNGGDSNKEHGIITMIEGFENTVIEPIDYVAPESAVTIASGAIDSYASVKISDLIGLVSRVSELEAKVAMFEDLEARIAALENPVEPEPEENETPVEPTEEPTEETPEVNE